MSQWHSLIRNKANNIMGHLRKSMARTSRKVVIPLCLVLVRLT